MKWRPRKPIPWDELAPPGMNGRKRWWGSVAALAVAVFWALSLFGDACSYEIKGYEHRIELYGAYGASFPINLFDDMLWPSLWGFWFALIIPPVQAVQNYQSHYRGSRSIYLMRRLPDRWELHRRCLILPLLELAATLLLLAVLTVGFYFLYRGCAPGGSLPLSWDQGPVYRFFYDLFT